jgi:hypothetical protein
MKEDFHFSFIEKYFKENSLVDHHLSSVNDFYDTSLPKIFMDKNVIIINFNLKIYSSKSFVLFKVNLAI